MEPRGSGVNQKSYFVANDLHGPWIELDDCKPSHLRAARKIKYLLTGNLNSPVVSNPWFDGKESDYLRCQIARITHNITIIANVGKYKLAAGQEPNRQIEIEGPIDDAKNPDINECLNIKNWVHFLPNILYEGRHVHMEREVEEGKDPELIKKEQLAKDPFEPRLRSVTLDKPIKSSIPSIKIPAWKLSYCYEDRIYTNPDIEIKQGDDAGEQKDNSINNTIVNLKSLVWPGAQVVKIKDKIFYFYFGWGLKYSDDILDEKFVYQTFPKIETENVDLPVGLEPNAPVEVIDKDNNGPTDNQGD
jgi:radial spoke head protein 4A